MKLWVDDMRPAPGGWQWALDVNTAIGYFETQTITDVSLDHDLGGTATIIPLVEYMLYHGQIPDTIYVHTSNPPAGDKIQSMFHSYGIKTVRVPISALSRHMLAPSSWV